MHSVTIQGVIAVVLLFGPSAGYGQPLPNALSEARQSVGLRHYGACKPCPSFDVTLYSNGEVVFNGRQKVKAVGQSTGSISSEIVIALIKELEDVGVWDLADQYIDDQVQDAERFDLVLVKDGKRKAITFNRISGRPGVDLYRVARKIHAYANVRQWICPSPVMNEFNCHENRWSMPGF